jgi:hypothetical protein
MYVFRANLFADAHEIANAKLFPLVMRLRQ